MHKMIQQKPQFSLIKIDFLLFSELDLIFEGRSVEIKYQLHT